MTLKGMKCEPCEGGVPAMTNDEAQGHLAELSGWSLEEKSITKEYMFKNFKETMVFVNKVADIAEEEGHHPDMMVSYGKVSITLSTHAIGGLSINDFILAAKIDSV